MATLRGDISFRYLKQFLLVKYDLFVYQSLLQCNWGSCERMAFLEFDNILVLYSLSASEISYNAYIFPDVVQQLGIWYEDGQQTSILVLTGITIPHEMDFPVCLVLYPSENHFSSSVTHVSHHISKYYMVT
jgi:hypothetical protein